MGGDEGSTETLGDLQTFEDTFNDEVHKEDMQLEGMLHQLLTTLQPHEAEVLRLRYGLDNGKVKSQQEVSNFLQIHPTPSSGTSTAPCRRCGTRRARTGCTPH